MGLWSCPEHGLTGPGACCRRSSYVTAGPFEVVTAGARTEDASPESPESPCGVPGCFVCAGLVGRAPRTE